MIVYPERRPRRYAKHYCQVVGEIVAYYRDECPNCQPQTEEANNIMKPNVCIHDIKQYDWGKYKCVNCGKEATI